MEVQPPVLANNPVDEVREEKLQHDAVQDARWEQENLNPEFEADEQYEEDGL